MPAACAARDAEEVVLVPRWARGWVPELRERYPRVPERIGRRLKSVDEREFTAAVAVTGCVVTAAAADGHRAGGRSAFYQASLNAFGRHGLVQLAQAAALRGYTPGSVTSPPLVIPFTAGAVQPERELSPAGVRRHDRSAPATGRAGERSPPCGG
ncbi:HXXEE domain-containing protein [Streptomyces sp. NPDC003635]